VIAAILNNLGLLYHDCNDLTTAEKLWTESLSIRRLLGDKEGIAAAFFNLGTVAFEKRDYETSSKQFLQALVCYYDLRETTNLACPFLFLAAVSAAKEQYRAAAVLLGSADTHLQSEAWGPREARVYKQVSSLIEQKLGINGFSAAVGAGQALTTDQALAHARASV
jgi:hypothetical protein